MCRDWPFCTSNLEQSSNQLQMQAAPSACPCALWRKRPWSLVEAVFVSVDPSMVPRLLQEHLDTCRHHLQITGSTPFWFPHLSLQLRRSFQVLHQCAPCEHRETLCGGKCIHGSFMDGMRAYIAPNACLLQEMLPSWERTGSQCLLCNSSCSAACTSKSSQAHSGFKPRLLCMQLCALCMKFRGRSIDAH